jgi:two-component system sensor kinase FixL
MMNWLPEVSIISISLLAPPVLRNGDKAPPPLSADFTMKVRPFPDPGKFAIVRRFIADNPYHAQDPAGPTWTIARNGSKIPRGVKMGHRTSVTATESTRRLLRWIAKSAATQSESRAVSILVYDPDDGSLHFEVSHGLSGELVHCLQRALSREDRDCFKLSLQLGQRVTIEDIVHDPLWPVSCREVGVADGIRSCFIEPIRSSEERVLGLLAFFYAFQGPPSTRDQESVAELLEALGPAVELHELDRLAKERDARLKAILEAAVEGIVITNEAGIIEVFSSAAERVFGYGTDEAVGRSFTSLMPELQRQEHQNFLEDYVRTGRDKVLGIGREILGKRKDGAVFPMELSIGELATVEEERRFIVIVRDITERKEFEELLRQREEVVRLTFENAPQAIASTDLSGRFARVNKAFCDMLGYPEKELLRMTFKDVTHPPDIDISAEFLNKIATGEITKYTLRKRYIRSDGQTVHALLHCGIVHDKKGLPRMLVAQIEDLTQRLKAEEEVRLHRERLTHVARVSTMGEMATGIAHEVNQPLTAIANYAQACRRMIEAGMGDDPDVMETLTQISDEAIRAGGIIHRLRNLVRKRRSRRLLCNINELIRDVLMLAEADLRHHSLSLQLELADGLPPILADDIQIQQVVLNLIRNGIDATLEANGRDDAITVRTSLGRAGEIEVAVIDMGVGFPEGAGSEYFQPFFTTKESGMGLGLSISQSIITSHGGRLWFSRNAEGGSTVHFTLPVAVGEAYEASGS